MILYHGCRETKWHMWQLVWHTYMYNIIDFYLIFLFLRNFIIQEQNWIKICQMSRDLVTSPCPRQATRQVIYRDLQGMQPATRLTLEQKRALEHKCIWRSGMREITFLATLCQTPFCQITLPFATCAWESKVSLLAGYMESRNMLWVCLRK